MGKRPTSIASLKPDPRNPREISAEALEGLQVSLQEFGDISGLVFNTRTGHLVCGHQRLKALQERFGKDLRFDKNKCCLHAGDRVFPIRLVDWDEGFAAAANIAANNPLIAGMFTSEVDLMVEEIEVKFPELSQSLRLSDLLNERSSEIDYGTGGKDEFDSDGRKLSEDHVVEITVPKQTWTDSFVDRLEKFCKAEGVEYKVR